MKSVTPLEVKRKETSTTTVVNSTNAGTQAQNRSESMDRTSVGKQAEQEGTKTEEYAHSHIPDVDAEGLSAEQKTTVRKMLEEEAESFSKTDEDIGRAEELQVNINLTDPTTDQKNYTSIPRPFTQKSNSMSKIC